MAAILGEQRAGQRGWRRVSVGKSGRDEVRENGSQSFRMCGPAIVRTSEMRRGLTFSTVSIHCHVVNR